MRAEVADGHNETFSGSVLSVESILCRRMWARIRETRLGINAAVRMKSSAPGGETTFALKGRRRQGRYRLRGDLRQWKTYGTPHYPAVQCLARIHTIDHFTIF